MKKAAVFLLVASLITSVFAGCSQQELPDDNPSSEVSSSSGVSSSDTATSEDASSVASSVESSDSTSSPGSTTSTTVSGTSSTSSSTTSSSGGLDDLDQDWSGDQEVVQDLGRINLEPYPVDINYDWGQCVLNIDGVYKMWWTRGSPHDGVWYAESKDLKNWTNLQCIVKVTEDKEFMKFHICDPAVVYVNGTYYFYFETETLPSGSNGSDNCILMATSKDGINLNFHGGNDNPQPVLRVDTADAGKGNYGVAMPSVIYKDGKFMMWYYDGSGAEQGIRLATSRDGINFTSNKKNPLVFDRSGIGVAYNTLTGKYMMTFELNPSGFDSSKENISNVYIMESDDGINWTYDTVRQAAACEIKANNDEHKIRCFPGFVTDGHGMINTPTFYMIYTEGKHAAADEWWMTHFDTFDGHISAVNLKEYAKRPIDLPNGKKVSDSNLKAYADTNVVWKSLTANAKYGTPVIDGTMDNLYKSSSELAVNRQVSVYGMLPTKTTATARLLWDDEALYIYAYVKDSVIDYSYKLTNMGELFHRDSLVVFVDVPHDSDGSETGYTPLQYCFEICANGDWVMINPTTNLVISDEFTVKSKVKRVSDGYIVEASVSWNELIKDQVKAGKTIGLDIGINDAVGGDRINAINWSDWTGENFRYYSRCGDIKLVK